MWRYKTTNVGHSLFLSRNRELGTEKEVSGDKIFIAITQIFWLSIGCDSWWFKRVHNALWCWRRHHGSYLIVNTSFYVRKMRFRQEEYLDQNYTLTSTSWQKFRFSQANAFPLCMEIQRNVDCIKKQQTIWDRFCWRFTVCWRASLKILGWPWSQ